VWATRHCLKFSFSRREVPGRASQVLNFLFLDLGGPQASIHVSTSQLSLSRPDNPRRALILLIPHRPLAVGKNSTSSPFFRPSRPLAVGNLQSFHPSWAILFFSPSIRVFFFFAVLDLPSALRTPLPTPITQTPLPPLLGSSLPVLPLLLLLLLHRSLFTVHHSLPLHNSHCCIVRHHPFTFSFTFLYLIFLHLIVSSSHSSTPSSSTLSSTSTISPSLQLSTIAISFIININNTFSTSPRHIVTHRLLHQFSTTNSFSHSWYSAQPFKFSLKYLKFPSTLCGLCPPRGT
jgi:hypothetical protein